MFIPKESTLKMLKETNKKELFKLLLFLGLSGKKLNLGLLKCLHWPVESAIMIWRESSRMKK